MIQWIAFTIVMLGLIALDLTIHKGREISAKEAAKWSFGWIMLALIFNAVIAYTMGPQSGLEFLAGYLIELSMSVDNLFVFLLIFTYFQVPLAHQPKVLFWGVIGALIMRFIFIVLGISLVHSMQWIFYLFGFILVITGALMLRKKEHTFDPQKNVVLQCVKKWIPFVTENINGKFFVRKNRELYATPLFAVLVAVETTDLLFAIDSIPAVFGVTLDPFIVYTSNVFAVLGLRSLYFALHHLVKYFSCFHYGVCVVLIGVGLKMLVSPFFKVPTIATLLAIGSILAISILFSRYDKHSSSHQS